MRTRIGRRQGATLLEESRAEDVLVTVERMKSLADDENQEGPLKARNYTEGQQQRKKKNDSSS
jgi:hypothetical protein